MVPASGTSTAFMAITTAGIAAIAWSNTATRTRACASAASFAHAAPLASTG